MDDDDDCLGDGNDVHGNDSNDDDDSRRWVALAVAAGTYRGGNGVRRGLVGDERMEAGRIRVNGIS